MGHGPTGRQRMGGSSRNRRHKGRKWWHEAHRLQRHTLAVEQLARGGGGRRLLGGLQAALFARLFLVRLLVLEAEVVVELPLCQRHSCSMRSHVEARHGDLLAVDRAVGLELVPLLLTESAESAQCVNATSLAFLSLCARASLTESASGE